MRNKREVPTSSQILFLSQIDDSFHHTSSTPPSSDKPTVHVHGLTSHRVDVAAGGSVPSKPSSFISLSQKATATPPIPPEPIATKFAATQVLPVPSPKKQSTPPKRRTATTTHAMTLEELDYNQLIQRLQHKTLSLDLLLSTFSTCLASLRCIAVREMRFILLQNLVTTSSSRSKRQYAQQVFDCLQKSFPSATAQLSAVSTRPFQWKQPPPIAVAPSVETLLCAEFPFLFKTC